MDLTKATPEEFSEVRGFYWDLIDRIGDNSQTVKWEKGVYPSDGFLKDSLEKGDLYLRKPSLPSVPPLSGSSVREIPRSERKTANPS